MEYGQILKIDLDLKFKFQAIKQLKERLIFLNRVDMLKFDNIVKVELIKKKNYSCRIYLKYGFKKDKQYIAILLQAILGSDYKHTAITLRDYYLGIKNYNKLFTIKRYVNGKYKQAKVIDISNIILKKD